MHDNYVLWNEESVKSETIKYPVNIANIDELILSRTRSVFNKIYGDI